MDIFDVRIDRVPDILELHWETGNVCFLLGPPGIGKSDIVRQFAKKKAKELGRIYVEWFDIADKDDVKKKILENPDKYFVLVDIKLYEYDPTDIKGIMYIDSREKETVIIPWDWMKYFTKENSAGVLFLDELNMANPDTIKVAFQLIYQRVIANRRIRGKVLIVAAGNPQEYNYLVIDLPEPLKDRMGIYSIYTTIDAWLPWAIKNNIHPLIIRFLSLHPQYLYFHKEGGKVVTPRTWYLLSKLLYALEKKNKLNSENVRVIASGYLHPEVLSKFIGFVRLMRSFKDKAIEIELEAVIRKPQLITRYKDDLERLYLVASYIATKYVQGSLKSETFAQLLNIITNMYKEVGVYLLIEIIERLKSKYKGEKLREEVGKLLDLLRYNVPDLYDILIRSI